MQYTQSGAWFSCGRLRFLQPGVDAGGGDGRTRPPSRAGKWLRTRPVVAPPTFGYSLPPVVGQGLYPAVASGVLPATGQGAVPAIPHVLCSGVEQAVGASIPPARNPAAYATTCPLAGQVAGYIPAPITAPAVAPTVGLSLTTFICPAAFPALGPSLCPRLCPASAGA